MRKLYAVLNKETGSYLNYASKRKRWLSNRMTYYTASSPFPTLRPKDHIKKCFIKWIDSTINPEKYKIVCFTMEDYKYE